MKICGRTFSSLGANASDSSASSRRQQVSSPLAKLACGPAFDGILHPLMGESDEVERYA